MRAAGPGIGFPQVFTQGGDLGHLCYLFCNFALGFSGEQKKGKCNQINGIMCWLGKYYSLWKCC